MAEPLEQEGERPEPPVVAAPTRTVTIPGSQQHDGLHSIRVTLTWTCPQCGGPRGEPFPGTSYDGSRQLNCDRWENSCGHVDLYSAVRQEARARREAAAAEVPVASGDMPDAAFTHTVRGWFGEELTIGAYPPEDDEDGGAVQFLIRDERGKTASAHISSPAEREALMRALMESYRVADGEKPAADQPAEALCQVPGSCANGPGPHPFTPVAGDPLPRPCSRQPSEMVIVPAVLAAAGEEARDGG